MKVLCPINIKNSLHYEIFNLLNKFRKWELSNSDIKVLSKLYDMTAEMIESGAVKSYNDRMKLLFTSDKKKEIMSRLSMSYNTFNNSLSNLRKKNFIDTDNTLDERFLMTVDKKTKKIKTNFSFILEFVNEDNHAKLANKEK